LAIPNNPLNYGGPPLDFNLTVQQVPGQDAAFATPNLITLTCQFATFFNLTNTSAVVNNTNAIFIEYLSALGSTNSLPSITLCPTQAPTTGMSPNELTESPS